MKCLLIAIVSVAVHLSVYQVLWCGHHNIAHSTRALLSETASGLTYSNIDLSLLSPLQNIAFDGKQKNGIFTSMLWNISNGDGDLLNIPPYDKNKKYKLFVDVGLEVGSGLLCLLSQKGHENDVLIGLESHPINFGLSSHNMLKGNPDMRKEKLRTLLLPFALSDVDRYVKFNENFAPACGSILESSKNAWWCAVTMNTIYVPALSMNTLLRLVPSNYEFEYLKIDVEGAEELVLRGGSQVIPHFQMVSLEVNPKPKKPNRVHEANDARMEKILYQYGFKHKVCIKYASFDCHYAKTEERLLEAVKLHSLAISTGHRGEKMTSNFCNDSYVMNFLNYSIPEGKK